jgi:hypothetical protein
MSKEVSVDKAEVTYEVKLCENADEYVDDLVVLVDGEEVVRLEDHRSGDYDDSILIRLGNGQCLVIEAEVWQYDHVYPVVRRDVYGLYSK